MRALAALFCLVVGFANAFSGDVPVADLPSEARHTLQLIRAGGPFPYSTDRGVFGNREAQLPKHSRGYYREYTVKTPGVPGRGARRIIAGRSGEYYYTEDHYRSFRRVIESPSQQ
jgi:ribonuclease T1